MPAFSHVAGSRGSQCRLPRISTDTRRPAHPGTAEAESHEQQKRGKRQVGLEGPGVLACPPAC